MSGWAECTHTNSWVSVGERAIRPVPVSTAPRSESAAFEVRRPAFDNAPQASCRSSWSRLQSGLFLLLWWASSVWQQSHGHAPYSEIQRWPPASQLCGVTAPETRAVAEKKRCLREHPMLLVLRRSTHRVRVQEYDRVPDRGLLRAPRDPQRDGGSLVRPRGPCDKREPGQRRAQLRDGKRAELACAPWLPRS